MEITTRKKIWLSSPHMDEGEIDFVNKAFESNWIAPLGPNVNGFEKDLESYVESNCYVACLSSGTAALHLALQLAGVGLGDEVLCQSFTFAASANPIAYLGATPVFIDSEPFTWNLSPELLEKAIKERLELGQRIKAIVAVHLYGMPYLSDEINQIAANYSIPVIEDSAEALGSRYLEKKCGTLADFGIFSFNGNKIITTSGGGALVTKNEDLRNRAIFLSTQARDNAPHYEHSHIGYNYRMSNVLAGIGRGQMQVLDDRVAQRRRNFEFYGERLSSFEQLKFLQEPEGFFCNRWLTCVLTESFEQREHIRMALAKDNIESRPLWKPMHLQPVFSEAPIYENGVSQDLFNRGLCLPSGSNLESSDLERVAAIIEKELK